MGMLGPGWMHLQHTIGNRSRVTYAMHRVYMNCRTELSNLAYFLQISLPRVCITAQALQQDVYIALLLVYLIVLQVGL